MAGGFELSNGEELDGRVLTVSGAIGADELGVTLVHEHVHADLRPLLGVHGYATGSGGRLDRTSAGEARWNPGAFAENYDLTDVDLVVAELEAVYRAGGRTVVDATPAGLGRDPVALSAIAERTGLQIVMGCGYYLERTHPPALGRASAEDIAAELNAEIRTGVGATGIRPGIIGEIGTGPEPTDAELKVVRGAALAQRESGLAVTVHLHPWAAAGRLVLSVLMAEGVPPDRVVLNHLTTAVGDRRYELDLLEAGAFLAYDLFGFDHSLLGFGRYPPSDYDTAREVAALAELGFLDQLLVSQDVGVRTRLAAYGGWGYAHLLTRVVPLLKEHGLDEDGLDALLVRNPRRALAIRS